MLFFLMGCAKLGYLVEQGVGQVKLRMRGRENERVLQDPEVAPRVKQKIRQVQRYKEFFDRYFERESSELYSQTVLLDREAVTPSGGGIPL